MPTCFIVPSKISEHVSRNGTLDQKKNALEELKHSAFIRGHRYALSNIHGLLSISPGEKSRTVYDAHHFSLLPGFRVRREGVIPVRDHVVNEAFDGAGATYDFYKTIFSRNSFDNNGARLDSTIHYRNRFNNAFWNGREMVYGDGDGQVFNGFTTCLDVIGHELTHAVTERTAGLNYEHQSGGLNEAISDIFGIMVRDWKSQTKAVDSDWLIGKRLFAPGIKGIALRSMKDPGTAYDDPLIGKDSQISHMRDYTDELDVHETSGIVNKAFCSIAIAIGGYAWEKAGLIFYRALTQKAKPKTNFPEFANMVTASAFELYPNDLTVMQAVKDGWDIVGITV